MDENKEGEMSSPGDKTDNKREKEKERKRKCSGPTVT